jgi:hypothetical protein
MAKYTVVISETMDKALSGPVSDIMNVVGMNKMMSVRKNKRLMLIMAIPALIFVYPLPLLKEPKKNQGIEKIKR